MTLADEEYLNLSEFTLELDAVLNKLQGVSLLPRNDAFRALCDTCLTAGKAVIEAAENILQEENTPAKETVVKIYLLEQGDDLFICVNQQLVCVRYPHTYVNKELEGRLLWSAIKTLQPDAKIEVYTQVIDIIDYAQAADCSDFEFLESILQKDPELQGFDLQPLDLGMEIAIS